MIDCWETRTIDPDEMLMESGQMRLVPDGPDRSPWTIYLLAPLILLPDLAWITEYSDSLFRENYLFGKPQWFLGLEILCVAPALFLMIAVVDAIPARRYCNRPWERPLTSLSTIGEWRRINRMSKGSSEPLKSAHFHHQIHKA